jgi:tRNA threonylcarbamoyladenosine biosynthesis protein TsaB
MLILTIRTDKPEAELGLFEGSTKRDYEIWQAHRQLAETIHSKMEELLSRQHISLKDLQGIAIYEGPGSFTGLRIGFSVANALAYGLSVPIVSFGGEAWKEQSIVSLEAGTNEGTALPEYGAEPHITQQKK